MVLAFDGMDPSILQQLMTAGRVPNMARLAGMGSFSTIRTSCPPHTPVAFSNMIAGNDATTHHIFDFIHRDPAPRNTNMAVRPYFSTAGINEPESDMALALGNWRIPFHGATPKLLRRGNSFWEPLGNKGVPTSIFYLPSNYPPQQAQNKGTLHAISGMGTPDLLGSYGEFTFFTTDNTRKAGLISGGRVVHLTSTDHRFKSQLVGPDNFLHKPDASGFPPPMTLPIELTRDPTKPIVKIELAGTVALLMEKEWSHWVPIAFDTGIPGSTFMAGAGASTHARGMVRLYVKSVHPHLQVYCSPINIDPKAPAVPISTPNEFAPEEARELGRFHTLGIPEDTKALSSGIFDEDDFLSQVELVHKERVKQYEAQLGRFNAGCFIFYFGVSDLVSHMFWRHRDPDHPAYDASQSGEYANVIDDLYVSLDHQVGMAFEQMRDEDTLMVMSDHGFTGFHRAVNVNAVLRELGYLQLKSGETPNNAPGFVGVDWTRTRAYALGLNAIYLNVKGREKAGIISTDQEYRQTLETLAEALLNLRDNGQTVVTEVRLKPDQFPEADQNIAPDLIVGYAQNYRVGWKDTLGGISDVMFSNNLDAWSGDHCVADALVPGVLLTSRPVVGPTPSLIDLAPTILGSLDVSPDTSFTGRDLFQS